ncbi:MAG: hypothetical protein CMO55_08615 [Verrucomicrobiales bacterium]|nr:hypothetical protein [Verrucomicrobiales bacterium]
MNPETLSSNLGALRNLGSVFGIIFTRGTETLFNAAEFSLERTQEVVSTLDDISFYFENEGRLPDQLSFGYDGANLLLLLAEDFRLVVLYHNAGEVDDLATAARAFLKDYVASQIARQVSLSKPQSGRVVSPTEPVAPVA